MCQEMPVNGRKTYQKGVNLKIILIIYNLKHSPVFLHLVLPQYIARHPAVNRQDHKIRIL